MKKKNVILVVLVLLFILFISGIYAYLHAFDTKNATLESGNYEVSLHEKFVSPDNWLPGEEIKKEVSVTNTGEYEAAVRIKLEEAWISTEEPYESLPLSQDGNPIALINFANPDKWAKIGEYYYYYKEVVPNEETDLLIDKVILNTTSNVICNPVIDEETHTYFGNCIDTSRYKNAHYTLNVIMESIQFEGMEERWGISIEEVQSNLL